MDSYYNEIEPYAVQWLKNLSEEDHIEPGVVDARDIREVESSDVSGYSQAHFFAGLGGWAYALRLAGWPPEQPAWTGSCPCQPFSIAGRKRGVDDTRHLWPEWFRLIRQCRPPVIFGEQVAGPDGLKWLDLVSADLESEDYAFGAADLCAAGVGAPHIRQRLYFCAISGEQRREGLHVQLRHRRKSTGGHEAAGRGGLADSEFDRSRAWWPSSESRGPTLELDRHGEASVLGDSDDQGPQVGPVENDGHRTLRIEGTTASEAGIVRGPWAPADLVWCQDRKYRPVGPGTFPLAHGVPARVGKLRAYGNAIVAPVAAAFIRAVVTGLEEGSAVAMS